MSVLDAVYDTNGCNGFFNPVIVPPTTSFSSVHTLAADGKSFTRVLTDGSIRTYHRVPTQ